MPFSFPTGYKQGCCFLVPIDGTLIPFVAGALRIYEAREAWNTEEDYERAYNAFAELEAIMTKLCVDELIEAQNRLYRLIDSTFNGRMYSLVSTDPLVVAPAIPAIPDPSYTLGSMRGNVADARDLLQQILASLQQENNLDPEMLARLTEIAGLLA